MIDVHSIISKHKTTTGAPVCLLSATPTNWPHRYPPRTPLPLPPTTRPPETNYAQYFFISMTLLPCGRHSNGGAASSILGRISILEHKTPQQKFLCSIAENFVEHNVRFTSCIFKVALHGYAGRPDRGLLSSPAARNLICGSWCRWGKCLFDVTKIGHAGWYDGFDWFFEVIFDGFTVNLDRWVLVHCHAAQYRYTGCWSHQSLNHFDEYIGSNSRHWTWP